ncbi:hypothetical protein F4821DRAFT_275712 [Hypoxylon rubiginosum]|uniref:Uncharacterized protein n=1 Tax=Hypoxylon rubiginosum TaxID=110542 RepID=A0ACC0DAN6_9PEZI|nr:hypothetical protein F4821DRAFT_275712 [Hypoxylon rubiginosum]
MNDSESGDEDGEDEEGDEGEDVEMEDVCEGKEEEEDPAPETFRSGREKKGKRGMGVNSTQWPAFKRGFIESAKGLSGGLLSQVVNAPRELARRADSTKTWMDRFRPPLTIEDLVDLLPKLEDEMGGGWTQEREDELVAGFEGDGWEAYIEKKRPVHNHFWSLWRKACQLRRVFPTDVVGPKQYLEYAATPGVKVTEDVFAPNPCWTRSFCEALDFLIVASPCRGDMNLLSMFIRYAVALRINDRRRVPIGKSGAGNPFLKEMDRVMREHKGALDLPNIGREARRAWSSRGVELPWVALSLRELERAVFNGEVEPFLDDGSLFQSYKVVTGDLKVVARAFKETTDMGLPIFIDMDERWKVVSNSRRVKEAPPQTWSDLSRLRKQLLLADMRFLEKRRLRDELGDSEDGFDESAISSGGGGEVREEEGREEVERGGSGRKERGMREGRMREGGEFDGDDMFAADDGFYPADVGDDGLEVENGMAVDNNDRDNNKPTNPRDQLTVRWQTSLSRIELGNENFDFLHVTDEDYHDLLDDVDWSSTSRAMTKGVDVAAVEVTRAAQSMSDSLYLDYAIED